MKRNLIFSALAAGAIALAPVIVSGPAHASCHNFEASHNGTDMFHETGAQGAAINKLLIKVEDWQQAKGIKKVRMTTVRTKCGDWYMKYGLPHKTCIAKVRACGR